MTKSIILTLSLLLPQLAFAGDAGFSPKLFAFQNGVDFGSLEQETAVMKELGYDGIGSAKFPGLAERIAAYDAAGLKVFSVYIDLSDPNVPAAIELLKNRNATVELTIRKQELNDETVKAVQGLADLAAKANVRIAFYPHAGFTIATIDPALEFIERVDRPNVGVMFNLCHFLKSEKAEDLEATIARAGKKIFAASTCGADVDGKNWTALIQPLDVGSFDQTRLFRALKQADFQGAVGIQCYAVKGDKRENLTRTMKAWKEIIAAVNQ